MQNLLSAEMWNLVMLELSNILAFEFRTCDLFVAFIIHEVFSFFGAVSNLNI